LSAAAREPMRRQWRWRVEKKCRHCSWRSTSLPSIALNFKGFIL
jgi:hypothetical protein